MDAINPLWEFSLDFYSRPGVEQACIDLQERFSIDVNLLLLCCWCAQNGRAIDTASLRALLVEQEFCAWREQMIAPLRNLRRTCKGMMMPGAEELYASLKNVELEAERAAQAHLYQWSLCHTVVVKAGRDTLCQNLRRYWQCLDLGLPCREDVSPFIAASFLATNRANS